MSDSHSTNAPVTYFLPPAGGPQRCRSVCHPRCTCPLFLNETPPQVTLNDKRGKFREIGHLSVIDKLNYAKHHGYSLYCVRSVCELSPPIFLLLLPTPAAAAAVESAQDDNITARGMAAHSHCLRGMEVLISISCHEFWCSLLAHTAAPWTAVVVQPGVSWSPSTACYVSTRWCCPPHHILGMCGTTSSHIVADDPPSGWNPEFSATLVPTLYVCACVCVCVNLQVMWIDLDILIARKYQPVAAVANTRHDLFIQRDLEGVSSIFPHPPQGSSVCRQPHTARQPKK